MMPVSIEVRFGKSSSSNYDKAIRIIKRFKNHSLIDDGSNFNTFKSDQTELATNNREVEHLWDMVGNWKSSELLVNDESATIDDIRKIFNILNCARKYEKAIVQDEYCYKEAWENDKKLWGCKFINTICSNTPSHSYSYGNPGEL